MDRHYSVIVCDLFHAHEEDHETEILGFASREAAIEYARRRVRDSVEGLREPGQPEDQLRSQWRSFGEDCRVIGPEGLLYLASTDLESFIKSKATSEQRDWPALAPLPKR